MPVSGYRIASIAALTLFTAALFLPVTAVAYKHPENTQILQGYFLATSGWLGPLTFCVAWYANIPFIRCVYRLARGQAPSENWAWAGAFLALSVFVPQYFWDLDGGTTSHIQYLYGPAIWLWLGGFAVILAAVYLPPGPPSQNMKS